MRKSLVAGALVAAAVCALAPAAAIAAGPSSSSSGSRGGGGGGSVIGGGGGGGGGGGAAGGGTTNAAISTVATALTCDNGSGMVVSLQKGFQKRVSVVITPTPVGVIGGRWEFHVEDVTHTRSLLGYAGDLGTGSSFRVTVLGGAVPVGASDVTITATRRDGGSTMEPDVPLGPLLETCLGATTVTGR